MKEISVLFDKVTNCQKFWRQQLLCLFLLCSVVYAYLYVSLTYKTFAISSMIQTARDNILSLQSQIGETLSTSYRRTGNFSKIEVKKEQHLLVIFTTFPYNTEKFLCRNNTVRNWVSFGSNVKPVIFSDEPLITEKVRELGWDVLTLKKTTFGIPILKYMFLEVMKKYNAIFYAFANGDILFTSNLKETIVTLLQLDLYSTAPMLIVGRRTNVKDVTREQAATYDSITFLSKISGKLFTPWGEDYFITNAQYPWKDCPEIVIGRPAYDNWLVLNARKRNHTTIDATQTLLALHQTDKGGDGEGRRRMNSNVNLNLLRKLYTRLNYAAGTTTCTSYFTSYNETTGKILLNQRNVSKHCFPL